jgi:hypothetical protein
VLRRHYSLGFDPRRCTIGPALLGEGLDGGLYLAHRALATLCGGPGPIVRALLSDFARQLNGVSSDTLVQVASGLREQVLRGVGLVGPVSEDA